MKMNLAVDLGDGPVHVETSLYVTVLWERKFKRRASDLANGVAAEDLAFMAHEAMKLAKIPCPLMFDDFLKKLVSLEVAEQENANPTHEAPTDED